MLKPDEVSKFQELFGSRLQLNEPLARYTAARLGGPAEALLEVYCLNDLRRAVELAWENHWPLTILGGGSNILVSDSGVRGLVLVNRCRAAHFEMVDDKPSLWAEAGANFGLLARQAAQRGWSGLEWAVSIPGTLGGALVGNAGAHGSDMAANVRLVEILHREDGRQVWPVQAMQYAYRSSVLKHTPDGQVVVLAGRLDLRLSRVEDVLAATEDYVAHRKRTQPPGASLGSVFKNPPGDYAGRLIEAAGLKGMARGDAQISPVHANFLINRGNASAADYWALMQTARAAVADKFGVQLEPEIVLLGEW